MREFRIMRPLIKLRESGNYVGLRLRKNFGLCANRRFNKNYKFLLCLRMLVNVFSRLRVLLERNPENVRANPVMFVRNLVNVVINVLMGFLNLRNYRNLNHSNFFPLWEFRSLRNFNRSVWFLLCDNRLRKMG